MNPRSSVTTTSSRRPRHSREISLPNALTRPAIRSAEYVALRERKGLFLARIRVVPRRSPFLLASFHPLQTLRRQESRGPTQEPRRSSAPASHHGPIG